MTDRTTAEVDRTMSEVDRTEVAAVIVVCAELSPINVGSPLGSVAQNTATTAPAPSTIFRLRTLIHPTVKSLSPGGATLKLQYATMSGTCDNSFTGETYADVTASTTIAYADNTNAADGSLLTANANDPTHSSDTKVLQEYNELNNTGIINAIAPGQDGLWDFALKDNGGTPGASYCFRLVKSTGAVLDTYSYIPEITISSSGTLSIEFVNASDVTVVTPVFSFNEIIYSDLAQTPTSTFGDSTRKLRVFNSLATNGWSVNIAATAGTTALWDRTDNLAKYDFNDSGANGTDSGIDADLLGGRLTVNPAAGTIASSCSLTGMSLGSSASFTEGTVDSVTLMSATSAAALSCNYDLTGVSLSQIIGASQAQGAYTIDMTVTVVAL